MKFILFSLRDFQKLILLTINDINEIDNKVDN